MSDFDWSNLLDTAGLVDTDATPPASIPFMITNAQRARLRELGYSDEAISTMTPEAAHRIIGAMLAQ